MPKRLVPLISDSGQHQLPRDLANQHQKIGSHLTLAEKRLVTTVCDKKAPRNVRQFVGLPPELTGGHDTRQPLPWPKILLIESKDDGIFLYRATEDGTFCGDTWHQSVDEAKEQATFEYGDLIDAWRVVPSDVDDPIAFALVANPDK